MILTLFSWTHHPIVLRLLFLSLQTIFHLLQFPGAFLLFILELLDLCSASLLLLFRAPIDFFISFFILPVPIIVGFSFFILTLTHFCALLTTWSIISLNSLNILMVSLLKLRSSGVVYVFSDAVFTNWAWWASTCFTPLFSSVLAVLGVWLEVEPLEHAEGLGWVSLFLLWAACNLLSRSLDSETVVWTHLFIWCNLCVEAAGICCGVFLEIVWLGF